MAPFSTILERQTWVLALQTSFGGLRTVWRRKIKVQTLDPFGALPVF